jgi:hypothetical protein
MFGFPVSARVSNFYHYIASQMKPLQEGVRRVEAAGARSVSGQIGRLDEGPRRRKSDSQNKMGRGSNSAERR